MPLRCGYALGFALLIAASWPAQATDLVAPPRAITSWDQAKRVASELYQGREITVYCGCAYEPRGTGGDIDHEACRYEGPDVHAHRAGRLEWEHVVPASTLRGDHPVWQEGGRRACERDSECGAALFDLHNLAPSVGQVNAIRSNKPFRELEASDHQFGACPIKATREAFEPPACLRGDVARVYLYMELQHGLDLSAEERAMFERWAEDDPVSTWEAERERLIVELTAVSNPLFATADPDPVGACPWESVQ